jgi:hypothetical protein
MGRLSGFKYRQIIKKLKVFDFEFFRHAAGVMRSGTTPRLEDLQLYPAPSRGYARGDPAGDPETG